MFQRKSREQSGLSIVPFNKKAPEQKGPAPAIELEQKRGAQPAQTSHTRRNLLIAGVAAIAVAAAGWFGIHYATIGRFMISTDDAYVRADNTTLGAKVSGYVADILNVQSDGRTRLVQEGDLPSDATAFARRVTTMLAGSLH